MVKLSSKEYYRLFIWCRDYINNFCIERKGNGNIILSPSGKEINYLFCLRRGLLNPEFAQNVSLLLIHLIADDMKTIDFQIAGLETGVYPLLSAISLTTRCTYGININSIVVRKERKSYGIMHIIEGRSNDKPILLMDDLCNSGNSVLKACNELKKEGFTILDKIFCIVDFNNKHGLAIDFKIKSLFKLSDFNLKLEE
jgi:orotate phosphoribosyltransferase